MDDQQPSEGPSDEPGNDPRADSAELVRQAIAGDGSAIAELFEHHRERLERRIANRMRINPAVGFTAEDVLQETYIDVVQGISTFRTDAGASFATWLTRVADNRLVKMIRDRSRLKRGGGRRIVDVDGSTVARLLHDLGEDAITGSQRMAQQELRQAVGFAIGALPAPQRQAIELCYLQNKDLSQIADEMNITKNAVRGLLHRAKDSMRNMLGGSSKWFRRG